jgi:hypothetical protein
MDGRGGRVGERGGKGGRGENRLGMNWNRGGGERMKGEWTGEWNEDKRMKEGGIYIMQCRYDKSEVCQEGRE